MAAYHFDLGDSHPGPIGYCARVEAESPESAVEILKSRIPRESTIPIDGGERGEYIEVYFNHDAITVEQITRD